LITVIVDPGQELGSQPTPAVKGRRLPSWLLPAALVTVGAVPRLLLYQRRYPLWIDEARLALNLGTRSFAGLLQPLSYDQSGPILFLWLQKVVVSVGGLNELSLRLVPLAAGLLAIFLVYRAGAALGGTAAGWWAGLFLAVSPHLTKYAIENKQYSLEALVTATLLLGYLSWVADPSAKRVYRLAVLSAVAVWCSAPAVFVLAGLSISSLAVNRARGLRSGLLRVSMAWAFSFVLAFLLVYRHASSSPYMTRYWGPAYLTLGGGDYWYRLQRVFDGIFWTTLLGRGPLHEKALGATVFVAAASAALVLLLTLGLRATGRRQGAMGALFVAAPLLVTATASSVGLYPMATRTMVFAAPLLYVAAGLAVAEIGQLRQVSFRSSGMIAAAGLLIFVPATLTLRELAAHAPIEDTRTISAIVKAGRHRGDVLYVSSGALPTYAFYSTDWSSPDKAALQFYEEAGRSDGGAFENAPSRDGPVRAGEGRALMRRDTTGLVLLGIPTGIEANAFGLLATAPDPGWAEHEAARVCEQMGNSDAWLVLSFMDVSELRLAEAMHACSHEVTVRPEGLTSALLVARGTRAH